MVAAVVARILPGNDDRAVALVDDQGRVELGATTFTVVVDAQRGAPGCAIVGGTAGPNVGISAARRS